MKKSLKKIFSLLTVAVILLSTLPIGASAAVSNAFSFEFYNADTSWIEDSSARSAYEGIEFFYLAPMGGEGGYIEESFASDMVFSVAYGGDFTYSFKFVNNSNYEFKFSVTAFYVGTYGPFVIPAATSEGPGVFYYTVDPSVVTNSEFNRLTFDFSSYQPVYVNPSVNTSYSVIKYSTPNGIFRTDHVYAPAGTVGSYVTGQLDYLLTQVNGLDPIPVTHNGFKLDTTTIPRDFVIDPYRVLQYEILYNNDGKLVQINYYDQNGNFITQESFFADVNATSFTVPTQDNYIFAPLNVPLSSGVTVQSFNVYRIDFSGLRDKYYKEGLAEGLVQNQQNLDLLLKEAFDNGKAEGLLRIL